MLLKRTHGRVPKLNKYFVKYWRASENGVIVYSEGTEYSAYDALSLYIALVCIHQTITQEGE